MKSARSTFLMNSTFSQRLAALATLGVISACAASTAEPPAPAPAPPAPIIPAAAAPEAPPPPPPAPQRLTVLFLGGGGPHVPAARLRDVATPLMDRGIAVLYSEESDLTVDRLRPYAAVVLYGDHQAVTPATADAIAQYVNGGGGLVALHSAAYAFEGSPGFGALLGGRGRPTSAGAITVRVAAPEHEIMRGLAAMDATDEIFQLDQGSADRQVLEYNGDQPQTWVRTHGNGRVFYTAWGHDGTTWQNPAFLDRLERGILWVAKRDVQRALAQRGAFSDPYQYSVLDVPFPPPHRVRLEYEATVGLMDRQANNPRYYSMQLPLDAEDAIERMILPPGFRVELFASEPDIVKPIAINWDERGRLWVVESVEYPYPREFWPDGGGKDRILIVEDTDDDGKADSFKVFADGLNIPTGLTFANGGVIVSQAPQMLFLKDTDGDDKADVRQVLFQGWSQRDTHAGPSHLLYGLDNWVWGVVGYSGFIGRVGADSLDFRQSIYRFRQDGSKLEVLRQTSNNTWGLGFNEQGGAFISTANGNPSTYLQYPIRYTAGIPSIQNPSTEMLIADPRYLPISNEFRQVDWVGAYTAGSGHALYTSREYPREYWNRIAFVAEPTGHLVGEFILRERGSTYRADHPRNLIVSDDQWFSPVAAEVGPDGQIWIADWYNYVAQHNAESNRQTPSPGNAYANPLRDRMHGRIYRIVYEGPEAEPMTLEGATPEELVGALRHQNLFWRMHAQRLLVERGQPDVAAALIALVNDTSVDETGINVAAIHALWTLHGLGQLNAANPAALEAARGALRHPSAGVRRNAVQVLPPDAGSVDAALSAGVLQDQNAQVRLEALLALSTMPASPAAGRQIFEAMRRADNLSDRWIREAAIAAALRHSEGFVAAAAAVPAPPGSPAGATPANLPNLVPNATFSVGPDGQPQGWIPTRVTGTADLSVAAGGGRNGANALSVSAAMGAEAGWLSQPITLQPNRRYEIGAWIRTEEVRRGAGRGAQVEFSTLPLPSRTQVFEQTRDWTRQTQFFVTGEEVTGSIRVTLGGAGNSSGKAWFDGVFLHDLGPEDGATLETFVAQVRNALRPR